MIPCTNILKGTRTVHSDTKSGPLFVWNVTSRCNLRCGHCYRDSMAADGGIELSDGKCIELVREIKLLNPPIVLLSGGEPLLRRNIFDIIKECKARALRVGLSTNGTLIDKDTASRIRESGVDYVGVSIDGKKDFHDGFRGMPGAFDASWAGLKSLNEQGVKTGVRFTLTAANSRDLMDILEKTVQSGTKRFCLYHLVYAGRASQDLDMTAQEKRRCLEGFFEKVKELSAADPSFEALTTDNPADGVFMSKLFNAREEALLCIAAHGGCSAGERVAYLDSDGRLYPCQFLRERPIGDVREKPLSGIWNDTGNVFLNQLRNKKMYLKGKCGYCAHKEICGGCRARARACYGSLWEEDPACYLKESEIGIKNGSISVCA